MALVDEAIDDLVALPELTDATILESLQLRHDANRIYTFIGKIVLVAVNPFRNVDETTPAGVSRINPFAKTSMYGPEAANAYKVSRAGQLPPHIFAIAQEALYALTRDDQNQCIIISGESGAGKTIATQHVLRYLALQSGRQDAVSRKLMAASPIMQAFGNARTVFNNNSSRFGNYVEVEVDKRTLAVMGARVRYYLLERSRVVRPPPKERNYHAFYCMLESNRQRERLSLGPPSQYAYLARSECFTAPGVDDYAEGERLEAALSLVGLSQAQIDGIFSVLYGILLLGNVEFGSTTAEGNVEVATLLSPAVVAQAATALEIPVERLQLALTCSERAFAGGEKMRIGLTKEQALVARDSLAKALYVGTFAMLVDRINETLKLEVPSASGPAGYALRGSEESDASDEASALEALRVVGILDIFGFENFDKNSYEQLCINFANEQLQQFFVLYMFKAEQAMYELEDIDWQRTEFADGQACLDLIGSKSMALLSLVDEECMVPKGSDSGFVEKANKLHANNPLYRVKPGSKQTFGLRHFAGTVYYNTSGFLEKNRDAVDPSAIALLGESRGEMVRAVSAAAAAADESQSLSASMGRSKKPRTVGGQFRESLRVLMENLGSCNPFFVRCIKPNAQLRPGYFDVPFVRKQLIYLGLLETVRVRKAGYPVRYTFGEFRRKFAPLMPRPKRRVSLSSSTLVAASRDLCIALLDALGNFLEHASRPKSKGNSVPSSPRSPGPSSPLDMLSLPLPPPMPSVGFRVGRTRVFMGMEQEAALDGLLGFLLVRAAVTIQRAFRAFYDQRRDRAARVVTSAVRAFADRHRFMLVRGATITFQAAVRGWRARRSYRTMRAELRAKREREAAEQAAAAKAAADAAAAASAVAAAVASAPAATSPMPSLPAPPPSAANEGGDAPDVAVAGVATKRRISHASEIRVEMSRLTPINLVAVAAEVKPEAQEVIARPQEAPPRRMSEDPNRRSSVFTRKASERQSQRSKRSSMVSLTSVGSDGTEANDTLAPLEDPREAGLLWVLRRPSVRQKIPQRPLLADAEGFVPEKVSVTGGRRGARLISQTRDNRWWRHFFMGRPHSSMCTTHPTLGTIIVSVVQRQGETTEETGRADEPTHRTIVWTKFGFGLAAFTPHALAGAEKSRMAKKWGKKAVAGGPEWAIECATREFSDTLGRDFAFEVDSSTLVDFPGSEARLLQLEDDNHVFYYPKQYKFGVLYAKDGQTNEVDMFSNKDGSPAFHEFLDTIADKIQLMGWEKYRGGLDTRKDLTGTHAYYTDHNNSEVIFHVSTLLPHTPDQPQQPERKRHLGNDVCLIVFVDEPSTPGETPQFAPISPNLVRSHFIHVVIVVSFCARVGGKTLYRVAISKKKEVPDFAPFLPGEVFERGPALREFILNKLINGQRAALKSESFQEPFRKYRASVLETITKSAVDTRRKAAEQKRTIAARLFGKMTVKKANSSSALLEKSHTVSRAVTPTSLDMHVPLSSGRDEDLGTLKVPASLILREKSHSHEPRLRTTTVAVSMPSSPSSSSRGDPSLSPSAKRRPFLFGSSRGNALSASAESLPSAGTVKESKDDKKKKEKDTKDAKDAKEKEEKDHDKKGTAKAKGTIGRLLGSDSGLPRTATM